MGVAGNGNADRTVSYTPVILGLYWTPGITWRRCIVTAQIISLLHSLGNLNLQWGVNTFLYLLYTDFVLRELLHNE